MPVVVVLGENDGSDGGESGEAEEQRPDGRTAARDNRRWRWNDFGAGRRGRGRSIGRRKHALDSATEEAALRSIIKASEGRTIFIISHRASVMNYCHLVIRLEGGRLVEAATTRAPSPGEAAIP